MNIPCATCKRPVLCSTQRAYSGATILCTACTSFEAAQLAYDNANRALGEEITKLNATIEDRFGLSPKEGETL